uniref:Ribosomal protein S6 kinase delta-1 n=1 Tax=Scleropages formosus TaxID=113540 RepID=A0A8C9S465_SCLFO
MISQRERGELARFYTVTDPKKHKKGYTVYKVTARIISRKNPEDVQEITVWKRYSDFRRLHRDLWQIHKNLYQQSELFPPFAKAKVFGRFDDSVIEERRQCSEDLLQFSANIPALYSSQYIEDFFKGGEVHDGSELIGPAEPFSDFLADSLSDCSSEVPKDIGGVDDLTFAIQPPYGFHPGLSSDSDLTSLRVDTDSLADVDDGMASGGESPNKPPRGSSSPLIAWDESSPSLGRDTEAASRAAIFSGGLRQRVGKRDYLERASEQIRLAVQKEAEHDYQAAFSFYRSGVDLLLQGVQGEHSPTRREAVKRKTAEYLMRAEQISSQHLKDSVAPGVLGSRTSWNQRSPTEELKAFRVLGVIDKVLLVMDKRTQETFILKGLRKSSECGRNKKTIIPHCVPNMVRLHKYIVSEDAVFLLLQHAEGGKLWSHLSKFLNRSPEDSFDIPFIQKSHTAAVHTVEGPGLHEDTASSVESCPVQIPVLGALPLKNSLTPSSLDDSSTQDEEGGDTSHDALLDSGATSEEECTNSYLTLCNEYEQEKIEPDSLQEGQVLKMEEPCAATADGPSPRDHPLLSNDSLCSPMAQELRFFTEDDQGEVFSSACLPVDSLDESKKTPMEFFRIDSKDSNSDVLGLEVGDRPKFEPSKPFHATSELEDVTERFGNVKVRQTDLWAFDSDRGSNESVPVISFKEALAEDTGSCDEGQPPDLLVNLPGVADVLSEELSSTGPSLTAEVRASPTLGKPDVLQLHYDLGDDAALALSAEEDDLLSLCANPGRSGDRSARGPSFSGSPHSDRHLSVGMEVSEAQIVVSQELPAIPVSLHTASTSRLSSADVSELSVKPKTEEIDRPDNNVSQLFKNLDELLLMAPKVHVPEEYVQRWAVEIIVALDALHQEGIICRDLNPNNILLDDRGHIQLTYFCSWSEVEDSCNREAITAMYCAPEVGSISEETDACDWWSLGAVLFELLTGKTLRQCHPAGISRHTMLNVPDFVSEEAKSLLQQLLQFNPVERLGAGVAGVEDIKSHPFFARVCWPK